MPPSNNPAYGRDYVFRLLKIRQRSEKELRQRLALKGLSPQISEEVIDYFKKLNLINDREFSRAWIENRLNKPLGFKAIIRELRQKGVSEEIISELIEEKRTVFDETKAARELAERRFNRLNKSSLYPQEKIKSQLYAYLIRRGFPNEIAYETINNIVKE